MAVIKVVKDLIEINRANSGTPSVVCGHRPNL